MQNVDLVSINALNPKESILALRYCKKYFNFGRTILFTHKDFYLDDIEVIVIEKLNSLNEYSNFILTLNQYLNNEYALIIQDDGHIVNPNLWTDEFLNYDYIGSPWPSEKDEYWIGLQMKNSQEYMKKNLSKNRVGNGGFSLRSKKFLEYSSQFNSCEEWGEDSFLCIKNYENAIKYGIKFAPFELALKFSHEIPFQEDNMIWNTSGSLFDPNEHFGWHGRNFLNSNQLISLKHLNY